jgi:hypothetical protein
MRSDVSKIHEISKSCNDKPADIAQVHEITIARTPMIPCVAATPREHGSAVAAPV